MEWHDIVTITGGRRSGHLGIYLNYIAPDASSELAPTDNQLFAIKSFYGRDFDEINEEQAHILLSVREYARIAAKDLFAHQPAAWTPHLAVCLAAFILSDTRLWTFAKNWSEAAFKRGSSSPRVKGSPIYEDVKSFADYVDGMLFMIDD